MATQLIYIPQHIIIELLESNICEQRFRDTDSVSRLTFQEVQPTEDSTAIAVVVSDSRLNWDIWRFHGSDVFALLLTPERDPSRLFLPRSLPDHLFISVIDTVKEAICGFLTGHDALEFVSCLDIAKSVPNALPRPPMSRAPRVGYESHLVAKAHALQKRFNSVLAEVQGELASYGEDLLGSLLSPVIADLSTAGRVGDLLILEAQGPNNYRIPEQSRHQIASLHHEVDRARALRHMTNWTLQELAPYRPRQRRSLNTFHVTKIYRHAFAEGPAEHRAEVWRSVEFSSLQYPGRAPELDIEEAMPRFAAAFDRDLLADVDPLVRSGLAWQEFLKIQPFGIFDWEMAGVIVHVLLRQAGLPPTLLPRVMDRDRSTHFHTLGAALERNQTDPFMETLISAVRDAVRLGRDMLPTLEADRRRLLSALAAPEAGVVSGAAGISALMSNVVVAEGTEPSLEAALEVGGACRYLHSKGLVDQIRAGARVWWSLESTRKLAGCRSVAPRLPPTTLD